MGPEGLLVLLILFKRGYYVSILRSHFVFWRGFKGKVIAEGLRVGQGEYRVRFKGRAIVEGLRAG